MHRRIAPSHAPLSWILLALLLSGAVACGPSGPAAVRVRYPHLEYPPAPRGDVVDDYFGVEVPDPYRWLEDLESPAVKAFVEAQNALSRPYLESLPRREAIKQRLTELWDYERFGMPLKRGGRYFYSHNDGLQNQSVWFVADSLQEAPRLFLDPNTFSQDGTVSLAGLSISHDGRYAAYARSDGGSDWRTWSVRDVDTGEELLDRIEYTKFTGVSWTPDSRGFFYSRHPLGPDGRGDGSRQVSLYYHRLGTPQSEDVFIYREESDPEKNVYGDVTDDGRYLIVQISKGYLTNAVWYAQLRPGRVPAADDFVRLLDDWDALYQFLGNDGTTFYFQTNLEAPRNRVIAIDVTHPERENWREVIPESEDTLRGTSMVGGHLIASYLHDVKPRVVVYAPTGEPVREVTFPGIGSAFGFGGRFDDPETFYSFTSFTEPGAIYRYDVERDETTLFRRPDVDVDSEAYETTQVFYDSRDGTRVPMFITHRKGIELDGDNPTLLYGYGGFDISLTPGYSVARMVWLEAGGVVAIPNLRGGGEYGREWHLAGTRQNKQNVFDDFIAAAEWLIAHGYTSTPRLVIQGGSNGGLLVGAVLTQRPDLFGAALPAVGVLDMLRYHTASANARNWQTDYGLSENEEDFRAQYAYSPVHNVREDTCYPPTLITTADHDDRVVPWHSYKFAAALQHAQACDNPVLLRVETRAGHGAGTPTWMRIENVADQWAFAMHALGMDE